MSEDIKKELFELFELLIEGEISIEQTRRLEQIVISDPEALATYIEYIDLHGTLHWDTARSGQLPLPKAVAEIVKAGKPRRSINSRLVVTCLVPAIVIGLWLWQPWKQAPESIPDIVEVTPKGDSVPEQPPERDTAPVDIPLMTKDGERPSPTPLPNPGSPQPDSSVPVQTASVVARIDQLIQQAWADAEIRPSDVADDAEWVRRVHLDLVGRIPDVETVRSFLADEDPAKREVMVDGLLDEVGFVRHQATTWTNLLVGRSDERRVRPGRPTVRLVLQHG